MKTLFLDFDGVLHPDGAAGLSVSDDGRGLFIAEEKLYVVGEQVFCWLPILEELITGYELALVIHSSWRQQVSLTDILRQFSASLAARVLGVTTGGDRHGSVIRFVDDHKLDDYAVLDDQPQWFPPGWSPLIVCDPEQGISQPEIRTRLAEFLG